ncbi:hypothetical protein [Streptomyces anulatus]|uniref:hypothetical protein n=1 Tax=Streptomyces anulatus TaxID=1892 RepID=UPI00363A0CBC
MSDEYPTGHEPSISGGRVPVHPEAEYRLSSERLQFRVMWIVVAGLAADSDTPACDLVEVRFDIDIDIDGVLVGTTIAGIVERRGQEPRPTASPFASSFRGGPRSGAPSRGDRKTRRGRTIAGSGGRSASGTTHPNPTKRRRAADELPTPWQAGPPERGTIRRGALRRRRDRALDRGGPQ